MSALAIEARHCATVAFRASKDRGEDDRSAIAAGLEAAADFWLRLARASEPLLAADDYLDTAIKLRTAAERQRAGAQQDVAQRAALNAHDS